MSLNSSVDIFEQAQISSWNYPVSDKHAKIWDAIHANNPPKTFEAGVKRVKESKEEEGKDGFALLGKKLVFK